jgi:hypothetical protein
VEPSRARLTIVVVFVAVALAACGGASFDRVAAQKRIDVEMAKRSSPSADVRTCAGTKVAAYTLDEVKTLDKALAAGTDTDPVAVKATGDMAECRRPEFTKAIIDQIDTGDGPSLTDANKACIDKQLKSRPAGELEPLKAQMALPEPTTEVGKAFELELIDCSRDTIASTLTDAFVSGLSDTGDVTLAPAEEKCVADYVNGMKVADIRDVLHEDDSSPASAGGDLLLTNIFRCAAPTIAESIANQVSDSLSLDATDRACVEKAGGAMSPEELSALSEAGASGKDPAAIAPFTNCFRGLFATSLLDEIAKKSTISPGYRSCVTDAVRKLGDAEFAKIIANSKGAEAAAILAKVDVVCPNLTV